MHYSMGYILSKGKGKEKGKGRKYYFTNTWFVNFILVHAEYKPYLRTETYPSKSQCTI
jgi:hypothetical protein